MSYATTRRIKEAATLAVVGAAFLAIAGFWVFMAG
jgi:hypothetical protein